MRSRSKRRLEELEGAGPTTMQSKSDDNSSSSTLGFPQSKSKGRKNGNVGGILPNDELADVEVPLLELSSTPSDPEKGFNEEGASDKEASACKGSDSDLRDESSLAAEAAESDVDEEVNKEELEDQLEYTNEGATKYDDDRVAQEVLEHRSYAKTIMEEMRAARDSGKGNLRLLLDYGESYVSHILAQARNVCEADYPRATKRGRRACGGEDDAEMLKEAEDEISGHRLFTRLTTQPSILRGKAKGYQLEGLNWLINLYETGLNGILADEMGLGKTFMSISLLAYLREYRNIKGPHLILAPKSTLGNWMSEIQHFCPDIDAFKLLGSKQERADMIANEVIPGKHDAIICSYEMCCKEKAVLKKFNWRYIIIDEAHRIKNECSKLSATVRLFKTQFRLLLTGTPLQNNLKELWALLNFLFPEIFSSAEEFEEIFDLVGTSAGGEDLSLDDREARNMAIVSRLHKLLKPFLLRRIKKEVLSEMPPKKELWLFVPLSELQKKLYKNILSKNVFALQGGEGSGRPQLLNVAMQLRKACNHPYLFDGYEDKSADPFGDHVIENAGKLHFMDKLLRRLISGGSRTLIFSQMTRMIDILEDYCRIRQISYSRIDGNTSGEDRDRQIEEFNAPGSTVKIFLLSTRAGGLGINLATADTVILYDSDWNPQVDLQAMDRAHRIGQKKPVNVYRLIHEHTIEEKITEKALMKLQLDSAVIQHGRLTDKQKQLSKNELMMMVQYGADHIFKSENAEITEADLDAILARGEERTNIINNKLREHVKKSIMDFSVNANTNLYEYDGIDYNQEQRKADRQAWAAIAVNNLENRDERESRRKVRLQKEQDMMNPINRGHRGIPRVIRLPAMQEWQFFERERILHLHECEIENYSSNGANGKFSPKLREEKKRLLSEGFADWTRKDFLAFIRAHEFYGRNDIEHIAAEVETKSVEEVRRYSMVFWNRYKELSDWEKWLKKIETGEQAISKRLELEQIVKRQSDQHRYPWRELLLNCAGHKGKTVFTEIEDRWILNMTLLLGYGNWEKLHSYVRRDPLWKYDWIMRSRTSSDLGRRVDALIRFLRKKEEPDRAARSKRTKDATVKATESTSSSPVPAPAPAPFTASGGPTSDLELPSLNLPAAERAPRSTFASATISDTGGYSSENHNAVGSTADSACSSSCADATLNGLPAAKALLTSKNTGDSSLSNMLNNKPMFSNAFDLRVSCADGNPPVPLSIGSIEISSRGASVDNTREREEAAGSPGFFSSISSSSIPASGGDVGKRKRQKIS